MTGRVDVAWHHWGLRLREPLKVVPATRFRDEVGLTYCHQRRLAVYLLQASYQQEVLQQGNFSQRASCRQAVLWRLAAPLFLAARYLAAPLLLEARQPQECLQRWYQQRGPRHRWPLTKELATPRQKGQQLVLQVLVPKR